MRIIAVFVLFVFCGFSFQKEDVKFLIDGSPKCLNSYSKYKFKIVLPKEKNGIEIKINSMNSNVWVINGDKYEFELEAGQPGITEFTISEYKNKKTIFLKNFKFSICK